MTTKEKITHEPGDKDAWICRCGNTPVYEGFYPCDAAGNEIEPADYIGAWIYVCDRCGRIIHEGTLEIIGRRKTK